MDGRGISGNTTGTTNVNGQCDTSFRLKMSLKRVEDAVTKRRHEGPCMNFRPSNM